MRRGARSPQRSSPHQILRSRAHWNTGPRDSRITSARLIPAVQRIHERVARRQRIIDPTRAPQRSAWCRIFRETRDGAEALGHLTDPVELLRKNRADGRSPAVQKAVLQRIDWVEHHDRACADADGAQRPL